MASEYWKWKFKDVKPEEKREMTAAEKRKNWWDYHKWHIAIAVLLAAIFGSIIWDALHQVRPDYQIAYVGSSGLPEDTAAALEANFAALGEDLNGDGKVIVRLAQYVSHAEIDPTAMATAEVRLMADLVECESYFFLLEDPEGFQESYQTLCRLDGTLPEEGGSSAEGTYLPWEECPVLAGMELGEYSYSLLGETAAGSSDELVGRLSIARRGFLTEKTSPYPEGCEALWEKLTEGASK